MTVCSRRRRNASEMLAAIGSKIEPNAIISTLSTGQEQLTQIAAAVGTCTPLVLDRYGVDPAIATGPFVTTAVDIMGLLFYFWLATVLLGVRA